MNGHTEEMSQKIMKASNAELEEISENMETEVYENLTKGAKARLSKFFGGI